MNVNKFKKVWTALITPFKEDGSIDWKAFDNLIKKQLEGKVTGIVISGTTGEAPTLRDDEFKKLIKRAKAITNGKCLIMAGSGTNSTEKSINKTKIAKDAGADVILLVNPYYNKPTQEGLYLHFKTVAQSTTLPVMLYNIKSRTGVNLNVETLRKLLKETTNIIGIKEASGDLAQIKSICDSKFKNFIVLSGDDNLTFKVMKDYGAHGVVSVASNIIPQEIVSMVNFQLKGKNKEAERLNKKLEKIFEVLFVETNPIPVKYAASLTGICQNIFRLPMCPISENNAKLVKEELIKIKII